MLSRNQIVRFMLGKESFGIDIRSIQEIVSVPEITRIPDTPDFIEGIINLRGKIVSIVDLRKRLKFDSAPRNKKNRILVAEINGKIVGLIVDEVSEVLRLNPESIAFPPEMVGSSGVEYITGVGKLEDRIILLLDLAKVMSTEETNSLSNQEELVAAENIR